MKRPDDKVIRWLAAELAMRELERYSEDVPGLKAAASDWFLDADEFDKRELAERLRKELGQFVQAMHNRSTRLVDAGEMEAIT